MQIIYKVTYEIKSVLCYDNGQPKNLTEEFRRHMNHRAYKYDLTHYDERLIEAVEEAIESKKLLPNVAQSISIFHDGKQYIANVEVFAE